MLCCILKIPHIAAAPLRLAFGSYFQRWLPPSSSRHHVIRFRNANHGSATGEATHISVVPRASTGYQRLHGELCPNIAGKPCPHRGAMSLCFCARLRESGACKGRGSCNGSPSAARLGNGHAAALGDRVQGDHHGCVQAAVVVEVVLDLVHTPEERAHDHVAQPYGQQAVRHEPRVFAATKVSPISANAHHKHNSTIVQRRCTHANPEKCTANG